MAVQQETQEWPPSSKTKFRWYSKGVCQSWGGESMPSKPRVCHCYHQRRSNF